MVVRVPYGARVAPFQQERIVGMKNLKDINKLVLAEPASALVLVEGEFPREVRLEINAEEVVRLAVRSASNPNVMRFLTDVRGRDTVVFTADEPCEVWLTSDGQVWWWSVEFEQASVISDAPTYTKIAERRQRNPELERVARKMQENADRRIAALMREMDAKFASMQSEKKADEPATVANPKGGRKPAKPNPPAQSPASEADGGEPDEQPPA